LTAYLIEKIGLTCTVKISENETAIDREISDLLNPKMVSRFQSKQYIQTFVERFGFKNNLSILDLLFNEGPNSICILSE